MLYDVRLDLHYDYDAPVGGGRHLIRVLPLQPRRHPARRRRRRCPFTPAPAERSDFTDFFGNHVTSIAY